MRKADIIIGCDPDVEKSGIAFFDTKTRRLETTTLPFPELLDYLKQELSNAEKCEASIVLVVEASWLIKSNWHLHNGDNKRTSAAKGNSTGRNHEVGRKLVECAKHFGYEVIEQIPLRKCWKGRDGKITHIELNNLLTKSGINPIIGRSNQEMRDSVLISVYHSGIAMRI